jgi:hypothetical protein
MAWETHSTCGLVGFPDKKTTRVIFPLKKHTRLVFLLYDIFAVFWWMPAAPFVQEVFSG